MQSAPEHTDLPGASSSGQPPVIAHNHTGFSSLSTFKQQCLCLGEYELTLIGHVAHLFLLVCIPL